MKIKAFFLLIVVAAAILCSCSTESLAPWDIPGSVWSCAENGISFTVPENEDEDILGELTLEDEVAELVVKREGNEIAFFTTASEGFEWDNALIKGSCKYDELTMTLIVESSTLDSISDGSVIIFFKQ